jgi:hypothetical protein
VVKVANAKVTLRIGLGFTEQSWPLTTEPVTGRSEDWFFKEARAPEPGESMSAHARPRLRVRKERTGRDRRTASAVMCTTSSELRKEPTASPRAATAPARKPGGGGRGLTKTRHHRVCVSGF